MFLTAENLLHYLLSRGSLSAADLVDGDCLVADAGRRNSNFKVHQGAARGLFVKQVRFAVPETIESIYREAVIYELGRRGGAFAALSALAPRLVDYDPKRHVLTVELWPRAENLNEHHARVGGFPAPVGRLQGGALARVHRDAAGMLACSAELTPFPRAAPWVLSIAHKAETVMPSMSGGMRQLVAALRGSPALVAGLDALHAAWQPRWLTHGDIKWDNFLLVDPAAEPAELRLIDWELADVGDADWDVACVLAAYVQSWLFSVPVDPSQPDPAVMIPHAPRPIEAIRPAVAAFWEEYARAAGLERPEAHRRLRRAVRYTGGRLVLAAFELLNGATHLTPTAALLLRVAEAIFTSPEEAAHDLYGLHLSSSPSPSPRAEAPLAAVTG